MAQKLCLIRSLYERSDMMLSCNLPRCCISLIVGNERYCRIELLLRSGEVSPIESLCAGQISLLRLALFSRRRKLVRRSLTVLHFLQRVRCVGGLTEPPTEVAGDKHRRQDHNVMATEAHASLTPPP